MSRHAAALRGDAARRGAAIAAVAGEVDGLDHEDLEALVNCLGFPAKAVQRGAAEACAALHAGGAPVRPLLVAALGSEDARLRWGAAYALGRAGDDPHEAAAAALEALGSDDGDVRWAAAEIVQRLARRRPEVVEQLVLALAGDPPERRKMALYCLRGLEIATEPVRRAAVQALGDTDPGVVLAALSTVGRLSPDDDAAVGVGIALLSSPNERLKRAAASALAAIGPGRAEVDDALERAAAGDDESLRRAAEGALRRRGRRQ